MSYPPLPRPRPVRFDNAHGQPLAGVLHQPAAETRTYAVFVACLTCSKDVPIAVRMAYALASHGFGVLSFDLTGLGESSGRFSENNFENEVGDLLRAAGWLRQYAEAPRLLIGHSLGGAVVLEAAPQTPESRAVVTIGAPATLDHITERLNGGSEQRLPEGGLVVPIDGQHFTFSRHLFDALARYYPAQAAARSGRAHLVMHAPKDAIVSYCQAHQLFKAAVEPRAFISLDNAEHLLLHQADVD